MEAAQFLCRRIVFQVPQRAVDPPSWLEHTPFAFWIIDALRPATFVELGCHSGNSYASFAQAVQTLGLSTACYAVDTWRGDPHAGVLDESVYEEWAEYHDRRFSAFSRLIRATFDDAREHFSDCSIDLLHVDGYHTYEAVTHDFESWRPKMSDRGVVLCHDINVRERDFGVWRLWERLQREYPSFEFRHGHGLGVLGIGGHLPDAVQWLLSTEQQDADTVRMFFARLGAAVRDRYDRAEAQRALQAELARRDDRLVEARADVEALEAENRQLRDAGRNADEALHARAVEIAQLTSRLEQREAQRTKPTIVVVSHVGVWRPRAGNEYRLNRMLRWYRHQDYRVIPVIAPLPGEELPREALAATADLVGNVIQVHRDGRVEHELRDVPESLVIPTSMPQPLGGDADPGAAPTRALLNLDRTFCHDALIRTVIHLQQSLGPHVLQVEYIWMSRLLPFVRADVLKVLDTHDVFSSIEQKVRMFGLRDVVIDPEEEAARLARADLIVAIQEEERQELQRLVPSVPVITAGVDFDVVPEADGGLPGRILYVASNNPRNIKGLTDFLRLAWPRIRGRVTDAELAVVGGVANVLAGRKVEGVSVAGAVDDISSFYRDAALVINPVVAGTGAKIKTLEALSHLRPLVTWPAGIDGLDTRLAARCTVARDWFEFANSVVEALTQHRARRFTSEDRALIAHLLSAEATYASLDAEYTSYFGASRPIAEPVPVPDGAVGTPAAAHAD